MCGVYARNKLIIIIYNNKIIVGGLKWKAYVYLQTNKHKNSNGLFVCVYIQFKKCLYKLFVQFEVPFIGSQ